MHVLAILELQIFGNSLTAFLVALRGVLVLEVLFALRDLIYIGLRFPLESSTMDDVMHANMLQSSPSMASNHA